MNSAPASSPFPKSIPTNKRQSLNRKARDGRQNGRLGQAVYTYGIEQQDLGGGAASPNANRNKVVNFVKAIINNQVQSMSDSTLAAYNMYRAGQ